MSKSILSFVVFIAIAFIIVGSYALFVGEYGLAKHCLIGIVFVAVMSYFWKFMQSLNAPKSQSRKLKSRSIKEELSALAEANPNRPGLKRIYAWFVGAAIATGIIKLLPIILR